MDSSDLEPAASEFIVDRLYHENDQVTLYTNFMMNVREDQRLYARDSQ
jgi:hypothetical protein